jgi:hypothetical protein
MSLEDIDIEDMPGPGLEARGAGQRTTLLYHGLLEIAESESYN